ncbi:MULTISPECIES: efflux RND transporter periplasmic adaptor subunit [Mucilaginibacter]|uniref:efflux RND transporter periplasmic adaptor subunit n=1 Tax=Mucilaginibacter TaxID=423349 RepID=UPI0008716BC0|nr:MULTISPECIES: efflux RND transporter periplasmic adaptor subunit [Mucilaginibacter]NVM65881.1 membrane fusion protein (multidrug efflux system) [Mucilaginibacter sp. SG538B]SCW54084.1 membrane fusion protein, multidrug efflux system [Mucilaginibacter sp. NFR10]
MKHTYIYWLAPAALLTWASCGKPKKGGPAAMPPTPVYLADAKTAEAVYYDKYQGIVVSVNTVELRSQVPGFVTGIFFKEGDVVQKGKVLYEIDKRKYQAAFDQAKANVLSAEANLVKAQKDIDRYNMLLKSDAIARQTVDQAQATYETNKSQVAVAKAALESARTDLSYATITAPFTGRIGISQVRLGTQVAAGTTLMNTISAEHPIGVDVVINEQDINRFYGLQKSSTDSTFKLVLPDGSKYNKTGKVLAIDRGVSNQTGSIRVRIQFPNEDDVLKDGMSCVLQVLNSQSGQRVQIPYKAVTEQMGEFFVFATRDTVVKDTAADKTVKDRRDTIAKQVKVKLGPRINSDVVIMDGIKQGDKVITDGFQRLRDGGRVTTGTAAPAGAAPKK